MKRRAVVGCFKRFADAFTAAGFRVLNEVVLNQVLVSVGKDERTRQVIAAVQKDGICWRGVRKASRELTGKQNETDPHGGCTSGWARFLEASFSPRIVSAKQLASSLGVRGSTLVSRFFFRAGIPSPKRYVANARLVTLGELWRRYQAQSVSYLDNHPLTKLGDKGRAKVLIGFFGEDCDVRTLTEGDQAAYTQSVSPAGDPERFSEYLCYG